MSRLSSIVRKAAAALLGLVIALAPVADAMAQRGERGGRSFGGGSIGFGGGGGFGAVRFEGRKGGGEAKVDIKVRGEGRGERIRRGRTGDDVPPRRTKPSRQVEDVVKLPKGGKRPPRHAGDDVKPPKGPKGSTKPPRHAGDDVKPPKGPKGPSKPPRPPQHAEDDDPKPRPRRPRRPVIVLPLPPFGPLAPPVIVREPSARPSQGQAFVPRMPTEPPRFTPPRRPRQPSVVPPVADLTRSRDREIIVAMDDTVSDGDTITLGQGFTLAVEVQYRSSLLEMKIVRLRIPDNRSREQVIGQLIQAGLTDQRILAVQPNFVFEPTQGAAAAATVPLPQYAVAKLRLGEAHRVALGRNVRVAVIDTGLDTSHPEIAAAIADTFDAVGEGPATVEAHGTAIAGIVAANRQIQGMAPDARVLSVRAFAAGPSRKSEATTLSLIKGLDWAAANNARVVNMSFAGPKDPLLLETIDRAHAKGLVMVAAAGNGGPKAAFAYPAAYDSVIAVTASDSDDQLYDLANRGDYVDIAAPGVDILAPAPKEAYEMSSGTSLAAAHISGVIALMLERKPTLTTDEIKSILMRTARDPDKSAERRGLGAGIVDAARAVEEVK